MKFYTQLASFGVLLGISTILGLLVRPTEMGIAVVAGALGLAFSNIDKIAKFKGAGFEAEMRERIETVVEKETEPEIPEQESGLSMEAYGLVGNEAPLIIKALLNEKYTWRYISGIANESGVNREKVKETLDWLAENALARSAAVERGRVWALTSKGRSVFANLEK